LRDYRNHLRLNYQVVCAIVNDAKPFSEDEISVLRDSVSSAARTLHCLVASFKAGETWMEVRLTAEPGFDLPKAVQVIKSVTSRRFHTIRPGTGAFWSPGYAAATLGEEMDAPAAAAKISSSHVHKENRA
jgi:REP element-mobilizing transposase RayT